MKTQPPYLQLVAPLAPRGNGEAWLFNNHKFLHQSPSKLFPTNHQNSFSLLVIFGPLQHQQTPLHFFILFIPFSLPFHHTPKPQQDTFNPRPKSNKFTPRRGRNSTSILIFFEMGLLGVHFFFTSWCYIGYRWWLLVGLICIFGFELKL